MPTLILVDGFEHQVASALKFGGITEGLWESVNGTPTFTAGRNGQAITMTQVASTVSATKRVPDPTIVVASFYFKCTNNVSGGTVYFATTSAFSGCGRLYMNPSTGQLGLQCGGVGPTYEGPNMADGNWHRIDIRHDVGTTTWTTNWQIDGTAMSTVSSPGQVATVVRYIKFGADANQTMTLHYDDLIMSVTTTDYPLGAHDVLFGLPTGDGTHNAGTNTMEDQAGTDITSPNAFPLLNETPMTDTADYIQQSTIGAGNYAEVTFDDAPSSKDIWGVEGLAALFASGLNANNGTTRIVDVSNNTLTDIYSGDMSETALHYRRAMITDPGNDGWTKTEFDGVKARVGFSTDVTDVPRWAGVMLQYAITDSVGGGGTSPNDPMGMTGFYGG